jgi:hypothetical protein
MQMRLFQFDCTHFVTGFEVSRVHQVFTSAGTAYVLILCRFFSPYRAEKILSRH